MTPRSPDSPDSSARLWPDSHAGTPEQALDIVRSRYARAELPDGSPAEMRVHEFEEGYLVQPVFPPATDAGEQPRPAPPGGAGIVVSKETGETFTVPNLPIGKAVELYRKNRARRQ